jgi:hypothetical protein
LDVQSTTGGFLPPRLNTSERDAISSPATGLQIYNTQTGSPEFYNGSDWLGDASATARGFVSTGTQTFAGNKTYTGTISQGSGSQYRQLVATGTSGLPSGTIPAAVNYAVTAANNAAASWIHIINNAGSAQGSFFGQSNTNFEQYNWQGGSIIFFTNASVSAGTRRFAIENSGRISIGASNANTSAILDVQSTASGFLPPRMTTAQRDAIATPAAGLIIYNTSTNKHQGYNGTTWNDFY